MVPDLSVECANYLAQDDVVASDDEYLGSPGNLDSEVTYHNQSVIDDALANYLSTRPRRVQSAARSAILNSNNGPELLRYFVSWTVFDLGESY